MRITQIKKQRKNEVRYNIYIDDIFCFSASDEDIIKHSLTEGKEICEEELENLIKKCEEGNAYNYALNLLSSKDYTSTDIRNKLRSREYSNQTIECVLSKLKSYGFIDDEKYIKKYIDYSLNIKKSGRNKIIYDLKKHGLKISDIEYIEINEELQYTNAYNLALKKIKSLGDDLTNKEEKVYRYLLSKGYDFDLIKKVIRNVIENNKND